MTMQKEQNNLPTSSQDLSIFKNTTNIEALILSDSPSIVNILTTSLSEVQLKVNWQQAANISEYSNCLNPQLSLILWDARSTYITLLDTVRILLENNLKITLLVVNGESTISAAVAAIKIGASDYIASDELERLPSVIIQAIVEPEPAFFYPEYKCLMQSEQQVQKLITENADGILVVDRQGIVQFVNSAATELLGKDSATLIAQPFGFPVVNGDFLEVDIPVSSNKILVAQMRVSQIQWQGANACIVSLRDITQLKQAEEERVKLLKEAQAANRAKDEFLAILSHELRTPLNPIVGWSQMLVKGNLSQTQVRKGAEIIQRNAMLQTKLIDDILDISRIIQGKLKLQICLINLANVINNALDTVNLAAQAKSIKIETNLDENIGLVQGDPTRLQQVVWNLLSNAVKFTSNGGKVNISLTSESQQSVAHAQIQIKDSGKGITAEFLPHVFDYFRQAQSTKSRIEGGLGLGLAIVRRLVELHRGDVTATSPGIGKGATFTVSLPISTTAADELLPERSLQGSKSLSGIKVLVVDDNDDSRDLINFILANEGAEIKAVTCAIEALAVIEQFQPSILVSDIGMPEIDGYELIQKIRQLSPAQGGNVMAIAVSGYASEQDRQKSITAGFDHHVNKPIDIDVFINLVI